MRSRVGGDRDERWAAWATDVDIRIDIERIMEKLADKYADSFKHLVALYDVTTQVSRMDARGFRDLTPGTGIRPMRSRCCTMCSTNSPRCFWSSTAMLRRNVQTSR